MTSLYFYFTSDDTNWESADNADKVYFIHLWMCAVSLDSVDPSLNGDTHLQPNINVLLLLLLLLLLLSYTKYINKKDKQKEKQKKNSKKA